MSGALAGLKVLDFSTLLPGPMASLFLADAGAEVVKVERPELGDEMRRYTPKWGDSSVNFALLNRAKKSLALDLKDPQAKQILAPLIAEADVLIEQFRPGVMARLGLGYDAVKAQNPDIIYCSISGYGQVGPKAQRAGHDLNFQGDVGLLSLSTGPAQQPTLPAGLVADLAGGTYPALLNILLALRARDAGQGGCHLDIAMAENLFPFLYWAMGDGQAANAWPSNGDALVTGASPRYQLYPTADGRLLAATPLEDKFWDTFCEVIDLPASLRTHEADVQQTRAAVAQLIAAQSASYWEAQFAEADCCCSIVRSVQEALGDPHFESRGVFSRTLGGAGTNTMMALPTPISPLLSIQANGCARAPRLGEHTEALSVRRRSERPDNHN